MDFASSQSRKSTCESHIEAATVTRSGNRLGCHEVRDADPRSQIFEAVLDIPVAIDTGGSRHIEDAAFKWVAEIGDEEPSRPRAGNCLREVNLPAQAVIHRQTRCHLPSVLPIKEPTLLTLSGCQADRIVRICKEPIKGSDIAQ